jgi:predicted site-specific integrase-resolvase
MRVALYGRVSKDDGKMEVENQLGLAGVLQAFGLDSGG